MGGVCVWGGWVSGWSVCVGRMGGGWVSGWSVCVWGGWGVDG